MSDTAAEEAKPAEADGDAAPEEEAAPTDDLRQGLLATYETELGDSVVGSHLAPGQDLWVRVATDAWVAAGEVAKVKLGCSYFCFLSAIDWAPSPYGRSEDSPLDERDDAPADAPPGSGLSGGETRFQVFARLTRPGRNSFGLTLKVDVPDDDARLPTWIPLYAGANWHERETWEMFGIHFDGHPELKHLYLPGAFEGNPLRKDFPLLPRLLKPWPGLVDVEPMPEEAEPEEAGAGDAEASTSTEEGASE